ncbi:MAG: ABC transporter ATP-binding protein [Chloroflexi bacterium]|nr:ABC transporter ATP-binding protein [Chloroflexota bacterium]
MPTEFDVREIEFLDVSKRFRLAEGQSLREFLPRFFRKKGFAEPFYALRDISFSIGRGEVAGIVGRNGSGKSTILKLIAGVTAPTEGEVRVLGRVSPLIELGAGFHPDLTGRENIKMNASILGMTARETAERFDDIVDFAELWEFVDTPVKRYSSGMYMRLGFAVAIYSNPEILLVDEVLSVGDAYFQDKCLAKMDEFKKSGVSIVVVSHSMELVTEFCDRVMLIDGGHLIGDGPPSEIVEQYLSIVPHPVETTTN